MGLSVVYTIVKEHGGVIEVDSVPGKGTTFNVWLPAIDAPVAKKDDLPSEDSSFHGTRVLFVDDEESLVGVVHGGLAKLGCQTTSVNFPLEALSLFKENPESFDVVITDYSMPKMNGIELATSIKSIRPEIPVILCTGFKELAPKTTMDDIGISDLLQKPISRKKLSQAIRKALDEKNS